ncbi:MAG: hypothetical protein AB8G14_16560 [Ilumatobacter sp.]
MAVGAQLMRLETADISTMSTGSVAAALADIRAIRGRTDQLEAALSRRISELARCNEAPPAADMLARHGNGSRRTAERVERRGEALGKTPSLDAAVGLGRASSEHADALVNAAAHLDDDDRAALFGHDEQITALASSCSPEMFRRRLNSVIDAVTADDGLERAAKQDAGATASIRVDEATGMHHLFAKLTPEQGNRIRRALDAEVAVMSQLVEHAGLRRDQLLVRALDRLICGEGAADGLGPAEVAVLIDHQSLINGAHADTVCEYSDGARIPVETARRHACDAGIIPVVLDGAGQPLDVGRRKRLATKSQRVALRSMYRSCAVDGCGHHFDRCHIHHLVEWEDLGTTDLDNLLPLCSFHHHRAHEGRWRLQLDPNSRELTIHLANGTPHSVSVPDLLADRAAC